MFATNIFGGNGAVCVNTTRPKSTMSNIHHIIAYHSTLEVVADRTVIVSKDHTSTNLYELFTKTIAPMKREGILENFTH